MATLQIQGKGIARDLWSTLVRFCMWVSKAKPFGFWQWILGYKTSKFLHFVWSLETQHTEPHPGILAPWTVPLQVPLPWEGQGFDHKRSMA